MSFSALIFIIGTFFFLGLMLFISSRRHKQKLLLTSLQKSQKNYEYLVNNLRDTLDLVGFGSDMGIVVDVLAKSLESNFHHSTLSSIFIKDNKLIFSSKVKEVVTNAFILQIKNTMIASINSTLDKPSNPYLNPPFSTESIEESITGEKLDDMVAAEIKSSVEIKIHVNGQIKGIVNLSSTTDNKYSEEDKKLFSTFSDLISGFLTRVEVLLNFEKSKSLAMIDSFSDGIFMLDTQNNVLAMNDSAMSFLLINEKKPTMNDILSSLPNTYNFKDKIQLCISGKQRIEENEVSINNRMFRVVITPVAEVNTPSKNIIGASVLLHDITLEKSLARTKEDFTNIMVHELRSPLTAIKASSDFLTSQADLTEDEKKRLIGMISESTKKMLDKISLILDSAKMDAGLFVIKKTDSDLKKVISERIAVFTPLAQEKQITLKVNIDPLIPIFSFDPIRIDEVINNLLSNSLKFTQEHGTISIQAVSDHERILVSVSDNGAGIPKDKQGNLFAKYQQAPSDGTHVGTGLGLYVVKEVVESHGGTVSLISDTGAGTTISFTLPLHPLAQVLPQMTNQPSEQKMVN